MAMEELRIDLGKQWDFTVPTLYRRNFSKFKADVKREELRDGFNRCEVNVSEQEIKLIMKRVGAFDVKKMR